MDPVLVALSVLIVLLICSGVALRPWRSDRRAGVTAEREGLRITSTELIDGYRRNATRHRLSDLGAGVQECRMKARAFIDSAERRWKGVRLCGR